MSKSEFKSLLYTNNEATAYWKKSEINAAVGYLAFIGQNRFYGLDSFRIGRR
ncbi:hypothetical protein [Flagellimonas maritima]|uniref:hypothetical protein n=1 Tax=Flagellimonas maritima TaxID=1383885 RepID=UPI0013DECC1A|nr:hypothetical protein [Allomuricauda aurantiaca]